jgi:hypothetical protein
VYSARATGLLLSTPFLHEPIVSDASTAGSAEF